LKIDTGALGIDGKIGCHSQVETVSGLFNLPKQHNKCQLVIKS